MSACPVPKTETEVRQQLAATDAPVLITPAAMEQMRYWGAPENGPQGEHVWPALLRRLERECPDYAN